jgi:hypothetical protein
VIDRTVHYLECGSLSHLLDDRLGKFLLLSLEGGAERRSAIPIRELAGK